MQIFSATTALILQNWKNDCKSLIFSIAVISLCLFVCIKCFVLLIHVFRKPQWGSWLHVQHISIDPIVAIDPRSVVRNRPIHACVFSLGPPTSNRRTSRLKRRHERLVKGHVGWKIHVSYGGDTPLKKWVYHGIFVRPILCTGGDRSPQALSRVDLPRYLVLYEAPASLANRQRWNRFGIPVWFSSTILVP